MPDPEFILAPDTPISVALEPAFNAVGSLRLLTWSQDKNYGYGLDSWVTHTLAAMTPEEIHLHRMVMLGLYYVVDPQQSWPSFPAFVQHLAAQPPDALRDRLLDTYIDMMGYKAKKMGLTPPPAPSKADLLASKDAYLTILGAAFPGPGFDPEVEAEAYDLIMDPPHMQAVVVEHLNAMWEGYVAEEWLRVRPMLEEAVDAFRQVDLNSMDRQAAAEYVVGQPLDEKWQSFMKDYERIVFVPSPHIGMYQGHFDNDTTLWLTFGARMPAGMHHSSSALSRAELLVRLGALADDTRLRILALIAEEEECCAKDVMTRLDLSQSAASRHLKQLSATGYLTERRQENAKCYRLNADRLTDTLDAVRQFLHL